MVNKERIRNALEVIAEESGLGESSQNKLCATDSSPKEIETERGLFNIKVYGNGIVEIKSLLGPTIKVTPVHTNEIRKTTCPKGSIYMIKTFQGYGAYPDMIQAGVCYVDYDGLVVRSPQNVRVNPEPNRRR